MFTALLLLFFGTAWMLYLEYGNRRFIENLPQSPATSDIVISEKHFADPLPSWIKIGDAHTVPPLQEEQAKVDPTPHEPAEEADAEEVIVEELMKNFESEQADPPVQPQTEKPDSSEGITEEESQGATQEQIDRRDRALLMLQRIHNRPPDMEIPLEKLGNDILNKLSGKPIGPGQVYFYTPEEHEEVLKAVDTLNSEE